MQLLQSIQTGRTPMPPRILLYGTEGIGKSTCAAQTPRPIFIQTEDGLGQLDCHRFPLAHSLDDVLAARRTTGCSSGGSLSIWSTSTC